MNYDPSEVKKLREQHALLQAKCAELQREVARLREAAKTVVEVYWNFDRSMESEIKALQKLIERSPVQTISNDCTCGSEGHQDFSHEDGGCDIHGRKSPTPSELRDELKNFTEALKTTPLKNSSNT